MKNNEKYHKFNSPFITVPIFKDAMPINVFHREYDETWKAPVPIASDFHVAFRRIFKAEKGRKYVIDLSADDYFMLYVNGKYICQGVRQSSAWRYRYISCDISDEVEDGENVIFIHAYYHGLVCRAYQSADNRFGVVSDVFEDGKYIFGSDESWKFREMTEYSGHTLGYDTAFTEDTDFRLMPKNQKCIDFDDSTWENAVIKADGDHKYLAKSENPIVRYGVLPKKIKKIGKNKLFVDFGKEYTGVISLTVRGSRGSYVTIRYGEDIIDGKKNAVYYDMPSNMLYEEKCILSGEQDESEFFDYKAFRYVEISWENDETAIENIKLLVQHRDFFPIWTVEDKKSVIGKIFEICQQTLKIGAQETLMDCPSREKGQYLGDFTVSGLAYLYLTGDREYYRSILYDFAASCDYCDGMSAVCPGSHMQEIADYSLQYPQQILEYYKYSGDKDTVRELLPVCEKLIGHFEKFSRDDGLLCGVNDKWNLVDWPTGMRDGYDADLSSPPKGNVCHNVINAYYIGALINYGELCDCVGALRDKEKENRLIKAFYDEFYDEKTCLFTDRGESTHSSLHSNVLPLFYGFANKNAKCAAVNMIKEKGFACGTYFAYFVLKALTKCGEKDLAFTLMTNESERGWVNMLREGATTAYEAWGKKMKWNTSRCHPWSCAPVIILYESFPELLVGSEHVPILPELF